MPASNDEILLAEEGLTICIHDLFLNNKYIEWRQALQRFSAGRWHSLIAALAKNNAPVDAFLSFGERTLSKLVFSYMEAPDYAESQMLMVQFTVAGSPWHCLIWHAPEQN